MLAVGAVAALALLWWSARPVPVAPEVGPSSTAPVAETSALPGAAAEAIVVHVAGAVAAPGLYHLPPGARVADALAAAGGPAPGAVVDALNLARTVADGEQLLVPTAAPAAAAAVAPSGAPPSTVGAPTGARRPDGTLDLNLATAEDLDELPGVGPVMADRILATREQLGGRFSNVGQLRDVQGIGETTFQRLAPLVTV